MGSFDYTCGVSGLPIHAGTKLRYLLVTASPYNDTPRWFVRTFPLKAEYNDYGSVENVEEEVGKGLWMEGFKLDLVAVGVGENTYHDVATSKDMSFDDLINSLRRVKVLRHFERDSYYLRGYNTKTPIGIPTMQRVRKILKKNNYFVDDRMEDGYLVDKIHYGTIRIRWSGHKEYGADIEKLALLQPLFDRKYVTVLKAGEGLNKADLLVHVRPGVEEFHGCNKEKTEALRVNHVMIREDVWQAIISMKLQWAYDSDPPRDLNYYKKDVYSFYERCVKAIVVIRKETEKAAAESQSGLDLIRLKSRLYRELEYLKDSVAAWYLAKDKLPYCLGLGTHWDILINKELPIDEVKPYLDSIAEFIMVDSILGSIRHIWEPSHSDGPQDGEWKMHMDFSRRVADIAQKVYEKQQALYKAENEGEEVDE